MVCGSTRSVFHTRSSSCYKNEDDGESLSLFLLLSFVSVRWYLLKLYSCIFRNYKIAFVKQGAAPARMMMIPSHFFLLSCVSVRWYLLELYGCICHNHKIAFAIQGAAPATTMRMMMVPSHFFLLSFVFVRWYLLKLYGCICRNYKIALKCKYLS